MATGELTEDQRATLATELGRHHVAQAGCSCGDSLWSAGQDINAHRLEVAFEVGVRVGRQPKPRRKAVQAGDVKRGHEIMSARRRILVTSVRPMQGGLLLEIAGTYKAKPSALQRTSTSLRLRPDREVVVMNWVPPIS